MNLLKQELLDGHPITGAYSENSVDAAKQLNEKNIVVKKAIPSSELLAWSGQAGRYRKIEIAADGNGPNDIRSIAKVAMKMIERDGTSLDLNLSDRQGMLDALVAASILSVDDKTALESMANTTISRAEQLGLGTVKPGHIEKARI